MKLLLSVSFAQAALAYRGWNPFNRATLVRGGNSYHHYLGKSRQLTYAVFFEFDLPFQSGASGSPRAFKRRGMASGAATFLLNASPFWP